MDEETIVTRWKAGASQGPPVPKTASLEDAIDAHVRPGDTLYFGGSLARPNAAMFALARRFWRQKPDFIVVAPAFANHHAVLVHGGLLRKAITSIHATVFPAPGPNRIYGDADASGAVDFEDWSLLTLVQRLQAGALGLPFMPTGSLAGTDLGVELERRKVFRRVADPFGNAEAGVVAALHPDVTFIHGLAGDVHGNVLMAPPYYDNTWAAFAARRAVIATVERMVDPSFIRRYAHLNRLPGVRVTAICEVALGGHPMSVPGAPVPEIGGYADDYDSLGELAVAAQRPERFEAWAQEWITGCRNHADYVARLGPERVARLRRETEVDAWKARLRCRSGVAQEASPTQSEIQVVLAARVIGQRVRSSGYRTLLAGLGTSSLAAWAAAFALQEAGVSVQLMMEAGSYGYLPLPLDPFLFNYRNLLTAASLNDIVHTLGVMCGGPDNRTLGVLAAAQVDRGGSLNSTRLPGILLTGSGGANDIASTAAEVLVTVPHTRSRLVERVDFVTSPGRAVARIVTDRAVLAREEDGVYRLHSLAARAGSAPEQLLAEARENMGWPIEAAANLEIARPPSPDELSVIRAFDPDGYFLRADSVSAAP